MIFDRAYFDAGIDRKHTECEKWDDPGILNEGGIPLWVADMDFPCPPPVVEAIKKRAEHPCFGYNTDESANEQALRGFWQRRHGLSIPQGQSRMLPCVITGLKACVRAFTKPGDLVAILTPVYGPFYRSVQLNGRVVRPVPLIRQENGRYGMDLPGMEEALRAGAKLIMLCNPHNPLSRLWDKEELRTLVQLAGQYDARIVSDEIHADFVYAPGRFTPILSLPEAKDRAVMLCAASKTFNIAGLQQAAAVSLNEELISLVQAELDAAGAACGNTFALFATRAAYNDCDDWLDGLMAYLDENRKLLPSLVAEYLPKARLTPVEATYLAWLDLRTYGRTCQEMTEDFKRAGVALTAGTFFGAEGEGFMRLNFACPQNMLIEGVKRMALALKEDI